MNSKSKKVAIIGMLCALAYVITVLIHFPIIEGYEFLKYDAKDIIIVIGGFIYSPFVSLLSSIIVSYIEMITISSNGIVGFFMNVVSTAGFAVTAAFIYKKIHNIKGAIIGLISGVVVSTALMLLWNWIVTPIYQGWPREAVVAVLPTVFLPFNLIKNGINAAVTFLIYKPIVRGLRKANLLEKK